MERGKEGGRVERGKEGGREDGKRREGGWKEEGGREGERMEERGREGGRDVTVQTVVWLQKRSMLPPSYLSLT